MAAICRVADAARNAQLNALRDLIDAGAGPGTLKIYSGTQPADADDAITTQTLLATLTFSDPSAPDASGGVLTFDAITRDDSADATDTATWARIEDSDGNNIMDVNVGTADASLILNTTSVIAGGPVEVTSFTLTAPAS